MMDSGWSAYVLRLQLAVDGGWWMVDGGWRTVIRCGTTPGGTALSSPRVNMKPRKSVQSIQLEMRSGQLLHVTSIIIMFKYFPVDYSLRFVPEISDTHHSTPLNLRPTLPAHLTYRSLPGRVNPLHRGPLT